MTKEFDLEDLVTFRLSRLADTLNRAAVDAYGRRFGLSLTEWRTLAILRRHQPSTAQEISRRSRIDKGWISRSVANLERRGLLQRTRSEADSRSLLLSLTGEGEKLFAEVAPFSRARHEALLAPLSDTERTAFLDALDRIQEQADGLLQAAAPK